MLSNWPESSGQCNDGDSSCPMSGFLNGMSVAMVGGIESLEKHYRQLIESMGGRFNRVLSTNKNMTLLTHRRYIPGVGL